MTATAKEVLRVQRKQFEMGLMWIGLIENPETSPEDKKTCIEQYVELLCSITSLQCSVLNIDLTKEILPHV